MLFFTSPHLLEPDSRVHEQLFALLVNPMEQLLGPEKLGGQNADTGVNYHTAGTRRWQQNDAHQNRDGSGNQDEQLPHPT